MKIIARSAGGDADEDYDVIEAGFSDEKGDDGLTMMFQRELSLGEWHGDPNTDDYFSNSYCITLDSGATVYGGLERVCCFGKQWTFDFSEYAAGVLHTGRQLVVEFEVPEQDLQLFRETLLKVVTWGVPRQVPEMSGLD